MFFKEVSSIVLYVYINSINGSWLKPTSELSWSSVWIPISLIFLISNSDDYFKIYLGFFNIKLGF